MKLSEAIRLGSVLHPQSIGSMVQRTFFDEQECIYSCALGAAFIATGVISVEDATWLPTGTGWNMQLPDSFFDCDIWRRYGTHQIPCPAGCADEKPSITQLVTHLNDTHRWTREKIADHVEGLEREFGIEGFNIAAEAAVHQEELVTA